MSRAKLIECNTVNHDSLISLERLPYSIRLFQCLECFSLARELLLRRLNRRLIHLPLHHLNFLRVVHVTVDKSWWWLSLDAYGINVKVLKDCDCDCKSNVELGSCSSYITSKAPLYCSASGDLRNFSFDLGKHPSTPEKWMMI